MLRTLAHTLQRDRPIKKALATALRDVVQLNESTERIASILLAPRVSMVHSAQARLLLFALRRHSATAALSPLGLEFDPRLARSSASAILDCLLPAQVAHAPFAFFVRGGVSRKGLQIRLPPAGPGVLAGHGLLSLRQDMGSGRASGSPP